MNILIINLLLFSYVSSHTIQINCLTNEKFVIISPNKCLFDKTQYGKKEDFNNNILKQCKEKFIEFLKTQTEVMVTSDGKLISKDRSKMPGFFSMLDGTSKTINICSGDRNIEMHSEMYFMKMSLDFINTLDADMIVKDNPTFFLFTFSSPCFKCLEEYKIINSNLIKNSSFEIFFYNIFQKNNINYLLKSEFE